MLGAWLYEQEERFFNLPYKIRNLAQRSRSKNIMTLISIVDDTTTNLDDDDEIIVLKIYIVNNPSKYSPIASPRFLDILK